MALATPEPATGIVDDTDRRQLLRNVQTNKAGHRAPPMCQPPGTVPGPRQYEWNWLPTAITRCPHQQSPGSPLQKNAITEMSEIGQNWPPAPALVTGKGGFPLHPLFHRPPDPQPLRPRLLRGL